MAVTHTLIQTISVTAGAGQANITFSSIPGTYTDLLVKVSARATAASPDIYLRFNGLNTNLSDIVVYGLGASTVGSNSTSNIRVPFGSSSATAGVFANSEIYIPNYASAVIHPVSVDGAVEENGTTNNIMWLGAGLWNSATAITEINLIPASNNFAQYSSASLYGIKNS
jgi:hypothetical protein